MATPEDSGSGVNEQLTGDEAARQIALGTLKGMVSSIDTITPARSSFITWAGYGCLYDKHGGGKALRVNVKSSEDEPLFIIGYRLSFSDYGVEESLDKTVGSGIVPITQKDLPYITEAEAEAVLQKGLNKDRIKRGET